MNGLDFSISSPLGLGAAHSHANPFSAGRLGPTTLQRIARDRRKQRVVVFSCRAARLKVCHSLDGGETVISPASSHIARVSRNV